MVQHPKQTRNKSTRREGSGRNNTSKNPIKSKEKEAKKGNKAKAKKDGDNTMLYVGGGALAVGGLLLAFSSR